MIQERVFARVFTALHSDADARCFGDSAFAARGAKLRGFAAKNYQTIEKFSGPLNRWAEILGP